MLSRVLFGFGTGAVSPAMRRLIIVRDPEHLGQNLGRLTAVEVSGFVLGPATAAVAMLALLAGSAILERAELRSLQTSAA